MSGIFLAELCLRSGPSRAMLRRGESAGGRLRWSAERSW